MLLVLQLDYKVDKKKLKEVFRLAGKVMRVELSVDKDGKSRGFGVVEFSHPVESVQAISMFHNQELYDRQMTVRMDRFNESMKLPEGLKSVGPGLGDGGIPLRDVAFNLPNQNNSTPAPNAAPSILGAVPNLPIAAAALNNLNNVGNLGGLNANAVLQAANLAGVGGLQNNLLSTNVNSGDLGIASLVSNQSLVSSNLNGGAVPNFSRNENFGPGIPNRSFGTGYDQKPPSGSFSGNTAGTFGNESNVSTSYPGSSSNIMRSNNIGGNAVGGIGDRSYSKILIQNVS